MSEDEKAPRDLALDAIDAHLMAIRTGKGTATGGIVPADLVQLRDNVKARCKSTDEAMRAAYTFGLLRARAVVSGALPNEDALIDYRPLCREPMRSSRAWRLAARDACAPFRPELAIHADDTGPEGDE